MTSDEGLAGVVMLALGAPLLLLGLLLQDVDVLVVVAIFIGLTLLLAVVRLLWRRPRTRQDSPWWNLLALLLVPIGFAADLGPSSMVVVGGLLFADGIELVGLALRTRRAARA